MTSKLDLEDCISTVLSDWRMNIYLNNRDFYQEKMSMYSDEMWYAWKLPLEYPPLKLYPETVKKLEEIVNAEDKLDLLDIYGFPHEDIYGNCRIRANNRNYIPIPSGEITIDSIIIQLIYSPWLVNTRSPMKKIVEKISKMKEIHADSKIVEHPFNIRGNQLLRFMYEYLVLYYNDEKISPSDFVNYLVLTYHNKLLKLLNDDAIEYCRRPFFTDLDAKVVHTDEDFHLEWCEKSDKRKELTIYTTGISSRSESDSSTISWTILYDGNIVDAGGISLDDFLSESDYVEELFRDNDNLNRHSYDNSISYYEIQSMAILAGIEVAKHYCNPQNTTIYIHSDNRLFYHQQNGAIVVINKDMQILYDKVVETLKQFKSVNTIYPYRSNYYSRYCYSLCNQISNLDIGVFLNELSAKQKDLN